MSHVCIVLKSSGENSCVIQVPCGLRVKELTSGLAAAMELPFRDRRGRSIDYFLKRAKTGQFLPRDQTLAETGVLPGEVLYILVIASVVGSGQTPQAVNNPARHAPAQSPLPVIAPAPQPVPLHNYAQATADSSPAYAYGQFAAVPENNSGVAQDIALPAQPNIQPDYQQIGQPLQVEATPPSFPLVNAIADYNQPPTTAPEPMLENHRTLMGLDYVMRRADSLKDSGEFEASLKLLLQVWWTDYKLGRLPNEATDPPLFARLEEFSILYLREALSQNEVTSNTAYLFLQEEETTAFFAAYPGLSERIVQHLLGLHRWYALQGRYDVAQLASLLALGIQRTHHQAVQLQEMAHTYLRWQVSRDPLEKVHLARKIYNYDPNYGNIANDVMRSEDEALALKHNSR